MDGKIAVKLNPFHKTYRDKRAVKRCIPALRVGNDHLIAVTYSHNAYSELAQLCQHHGSDKGANGDVQSLHNYTDFYEILFAPNRTGIRHVLECGIGRDGPGEKAKGTNGYPGASLRVWRDYFPNAQIVGVDILPNVLFTEERIQTYCVDQTDPNSIAAFLNKLDDRKFDYIIDDGLHEYHAGITFFESVAEWLSDDGIYIIEDISKKQLILYAEYFDKKAGGYHARIVNLHRPNSKLGDNSLIMITKQTEEALSVA